MQLAQFTGSRRQPGLPSGKALRAQQCTNSNRELPRSPAARPLTAATFARDYFVGDRMPAYCPKLTFYPTFAG